MLGSPKECRSHAMVFRGWQNLCRAGVAREMFASSEDLA